MAVALAGLLGTSCTGSSRATTPKPQAPVTVPRVVALDTRIVVIAPAGAADILPANYTAPRASSTEPGLAYGPRRDQRLDLSLPGAKFPRPRPLLVWLHPGGWIAGDRTGVLPMIMRQVERAGFALASVDYGLAPAHRFPVPVQDVKLAIRFLKAHAATYGLDPARVVLSGASAGGHLAALAATTPGAFEPAGLPTALAAVDSRVLGVAVFAAQTDLTAFGATPSPWAHTFTAALLHCADPGYPRPIVCPPNAERDASVARYLDATDPPAFLAYGALDDLVRPATQGLPLARAWARALAQRPGRVWYERANAGHNLDQHNTNLRLFERFLDEVVAGRLR